MAGGGGLLASLTKGVRAAFPFIEALVPTSASPTSILKQVRAAGFAVRTQQVFDVVALLRSNQSTPQYLRSQANNAILNPEQFGTAPFRQLRKYRYTLMVHGTNPDTGETINQQIVISTDQVLSKDQIIAEAIPIVSDPNKQYYMDIESIEVTDATKQQGV